jgi:hypothetical protein
MTDLVDALEALLAEHRRIGSPLPRYLRPGAPAAEVRRTIEAAVGSDPPDDLVELFAWHDGTDHDAWRRDDVAAGFARLFGDTYFAPLDDAVASRAESLEIEATVARHADPGSTIPIWRTPWFPAFSQGWEDYAVDCGDAGRGRVYAPSWQPPPDVGPGPRFRDLRHLVDSVVRRFRAGAYAWDPAARFLEERIVVLEPLYEREIAEARS